MGNVEALNWHTPKRRMQTVLEQSALLAFYGKMTTVLKQVSYLHIVDRGNFLREQKYLQYNKPVFFKIGALRKNSC